MVGIGDSGALPPRAQDLYESEYKHGAALFEKSLLHYSRSSYAPQKEAFDGVMHMAMTILNETAKELKRQDLLAQNQKIQHDLAAYQKSPTREHLSTLKTDLETAKKIVHQGVLENVKKEIEIQKGKKNP